MIEPPRAGPGSLTAAIAQLGETIAARPRRSGRCAAVRQQDEILCLGCRRRWPVEEGLLGCPRRQAAG